MYLMSITAAKRTIRLSSSYFVPNELAVQTMVEAMKRGVKLQIITPGEHTDTETVRAASRARWGELLAAGAEIYEYQPTMYHCKVMIVDEFMVSVGSTNFDDRSFRLNDEANLNIYDAGVRAPSRSAIFDADLAKSRRITLGRMAGPAAEGKAARAPRVAARLAALREAAPPPARAVVRMCTMACRRARGAGGSCGERRIGGRARRPLGRISAPPRRR